MRLRTFIAQKLDHMLTEILFVKGQFNITPYLAVNNKTHFMSESSFHCISFTHTLPVIYMAITFRGQWGLVPKKTDFIIETLSIAYYSVQETKPITMPNVALATQYSATKSC